MLMLVSIPLVPFGVAYDRVQRKSEGYRWLG